MKILFSILSLCIPVVALAQPILPLPRQTQYFELQPKDIPKPLSQSWDNRAVASNFSAAQSNDGLPLPQLAQYRMKVLTVEDAILLALRNNVDVISAQMQRVSDKYGLEISRNEFEPTFTDINLGMMIGQGEKPYYNPLGQSLSINTPLGTTVTATYNNDLLGRKDSYNGSLSVTQPLLRGFGMKELDVQNTSDTEKTNRLQYRDKISNTVGQVVDAYLSLVQAKMNNEIQQQNLKQEKKQFWVAKKKLQAGQIAPSDYRQQQATYLRDRLQYTKQGQSLDDQYQALIKVLGLSPASRLQTPRALHMSSLQVSVPSRHVAIQTALSNNVSYQTTLIGLRGLQRAVVKDRDALKWKLDATYTHNFNAQTINYVKTSSGQLVPIKTQAPGENTGSLSLDIPVNNLSAKKDLVKARVDYEMGKLKLRQAKRDLVQKIMDDYRKLTSDKLQLRMDVQSVRLQKKVLQDALLKYTYGKSSSFEVSSIRQDTLTQQQSYVSDQMQYFQDLNKVHQDMGNYLSVWHIKLRY